MNGHTIDKMNIEARADMKEEVSEGRGAYNAPNREETT